jgi:transcriptional regulator with XRE-family HTH domain
MAKSQEEVGASLSPEVIEATFNRWINLFRLRHTEDNYPNVRLAKYVLGINDAQWSQIRRGKKRPSIEQCLSIAHNLDVPLDEVLQLEGYLTVAGLTAWLQKHPMDAEYVQRMGVSSQEAEAKARKLQGDTLYLLNYSLGHPAWKELDWRISPFRERADEVLASSRPNTDKAIRYADAVWEWTQSLERDASRWVRRTGEQMKLATQAS